MAENFNSTKYSLLLDAKNSLFCIIWLLFFGEREVSKGIWIGKVGELNLNLPSKVPENLFSLSERVLEKYRYTGRYIVRCTEVAGASIGQEKRNH